MSAARASVTVTSPVARPAVQSGPPESGPRAARAEDPPAGSPVSDLAALIERDLAGAEPPQRWPLYVSAPLWIGSSGLLWWGIIKGVSLLISR